MIGDILASVPFKRRLIGGAAWTLSMRVLTIAMGLVVSGLLARLLSPEEMGAYFLVFSLVTIAITISQLGLNVTVVRLVAESMGVEDPGRARAAILAVFQYGAVGAIVVAGALYLGIGEWLAWEAFDSAPMASVVGLTATWIFILTFQRLIAETFRGFLDIRLATIFGGFVASTLSAIFFGALYALRGQSDLGEVISFTVIAVFLSLCLASAALFPRVRALGERGELDRRVVRAMAWPLLFSGLINVLLVRADVWILGMYRPPEEVAIYGAAARLITLVSMPMLMVGAATPMIAELYAQDRKPQLERVLRFAATLVALPALIVFFTFVFWGAPILGLIFGDFYAAGSVVLIILSIGQLVSALAGGCAQLLFMTGHERISLGLTFGAGVTAVLLAWALVPVYGMLGVAASFALAVTLQNVSMVLYGWRKIGIKTFVGLPRRPRAAAPGGAL